MELTTKEKKTIAVVALITVMGLILIQPVFLSTNSTESGQTSVPSFTLNENSNSHRGVTITANSSSVCPYPPCGGWW